VEQDYGEAKAEVERWYRGRTMKYCHAVLWRRHVDNGRSGVSRVVAVDKGDKKDDDICHSAPKACTPITIFMKHTCHLNTFVIQNCHRSMQLKHFLLLVRNSHTY
jgi:hypothetical protein